jgi:UDP-galactopyranose mutase
MIIIIGAGLTGLSTGYHLKVRNANFKIYEKDLRIGGLCKSEVVNGFTFDYTGHLLHVREDYANKLVTELLKGNLKELKRNAWIYSKGVYTPYPFQVNLYGLPPNIVKECLLGLIEAKYSGNKEKPVTFEDGINAYFGKGIAKYFMIPYNQKLWTVHPREMTCEWLDRYVPLPRLEEVLDGALQPPKKDFGYNIYFYYPVYGGIGSLSNAFARSIENNIHKGKEVVNIDASNKKLELNDGNTEEYSSLISTMPLPKLIELVEDVPGDIKKHSKKLRYASVYCVNIGVARPKISEKHWIYFPENDFVFYRVGFTSNFSHYLAPSGNSSIYAEISYSNINSIPEKNILSRTIDDLIKCGILKSDDQVIVRQLLNLKYAYVIYDKNHKESVKTIHNYLENNDIYSIGRYGKWEYSTMEDAILEGKEVANKLID